MKHKLTDEQIEIISYDDDMKVEAVAGSGKTSTLIEFAKTRPRNSKILYIVFNRSAKDDALAKFQREGMNGVHIQTAHGLAYCSVMVLPKYTLNNKGYNSMDIMVMCNIKGSDRFTLATHVRNWMSGYCNSSAESIGDYDYIGSLGKEAQEFMANHMVLVKGWVNDYWDRMDSAKVLVTHEFYLKKYHLNKPQLKYDYILFDEGQDASPVMLDIFLNQTTKKIIVGDTHQQIYSWRGAVNSLSLVDFPTFTLSKSFRFGAHIADLSNKILQIKGSVGKVTGAANYKNNNCYTDATISRTNVALLQSMISWVKRNPDDQLYFEGNINSLLYTEEGISVYDVIHLHECNFKRIKNKLIRSFNSFSEFMKFCNQADDRELLMMGVLADRYGANLGNIMEDLKEACADDRDEATMVFTTAHKSKGLEYDKVYLTNDFANKDEEDINLEEEVNILYVAVTRAKKEVVFPENFNFYANFDQRIYNVVQ